MDASAFTREIPQVAASSWIALGLGLVLGLVLFLRARGSFTGSKAVKSPSAWRLQGLGVGLACGVLYGFVFAFLVGTDRNASAIVFMVLPALATALAGQAVGGAIAGAMGPEQIERRVGHSRAVSLRDYLWSPVVWAARILVLAATIALVLLYAIPVRRTPDGSLTANPLMAAFAVAPAVLVLILIEVGARILVSRPSSAESADDLRRQDIQRVRIARNGAGAAAGLGVLAFVFSVPQLLADIDPRAEFLAMTNPPVLTEYAAIICVAIYVVIAFRASRLPSAKILRSSDLTRASQ